MEAILNNELVVIFLTNLFFSMIVAADLVLMLHVDILIPIVAVFINVICKAYPTDNEKHWIDGNYDDIP